MPRLLPRHFVQKKMIKSTYYIAIALREVCRLSLSPWLLLLSGQIPNRSRLPHVNCCPVRNWLTDLHCWLHFQGATCTRTAVDSEGCTPGSVLLLPARRLAACRQCMQPSSSTTSIPSSQWTRYILMVGYRKCFICLAMGIYGRRGLPCLEKLGYACVADIHTALPQIEKRENSDFVEFVYMYSPSP